MPRTNSSKRWKCRTGRFSIKPRCKDRLTGAAVGYTVVHRYIDHRGQMPKRKLDPLPAAAFQIMLALSDGDLHGYAIMREVEEQTGGRLWVRPGTRYRSLQTILD